MTYNILSTGSKGNAVIIGGVLLVDCGVPFKKIAPVKNDLKIVLLTHIHGDHFNRPTIRRLAQERPTLRWGCCGWLSGDLASIVSPGLIDVMEPEKTYCYGAFSVSPVTVPHDVPNCGWRIFSGDEQIFYVTDAGDLDGVEAKDYSLYMVEANHTESDIQTRANEKIKTGEFAYEVRAAANHLSEEQAFDFIGRNAGPSSLYVFLHQHEGD